METKVISPMELFTRLDSAVKDVQAKKTILSDLEARRQKASSDYDMAVSKAADIKKEFDTLLGNIIPGSNDNRIR